MKLAQGTRYVMGTFLSVHVEGTDQENMSRARDLIFNTIQRLDERLSFYRPESEISRINQAPGIAPVAVSAQTYAVIKEALHYAQLTDGAFDPTIQRGHPGRFNYQQVRLQHESQTVFLSEPGMTLDLGGIGKGFALDCALANVCTIPSLKKIVVDFGGQLLFWTPEGTFDPIPVTIENPDNRNAILGTLEITSNSSISTSSQAEHPDHLIDPHTQLPAKDMLSVSVVAPTGIQAEALSTAFFVLKPAGIATLLKKCPAVRAAIYYRTGLAVRGALDEPPACAGVPFI